MLGIHCPGLQPSSAVLFKEVVSTHYCFYFFINSATKVFNQDVACILFADDVKLYSVIRSSYDFVNLQSALDKIALWSKEHQLLISDKKCSSIVIGSAHSCSWQYNIPGAAK